MIGGADGIGLYDDIVAITPSERLNVYARASYDLGGATIWVDALYGRAASDSKFSPDFLIPPLTISASNPFRSEEHTSELQSLMRISYAVFCLKKKKQQQTAKNGN